MAQLRADVVNKEAGTAYKFAMARSEPYKMFAGSLGATAVVAGVFGVLGYILGRGH